MLSSSRWVLRYATHDIRSSTLKSDKESPRRALFKIPVTSQIIVSKDNLSPSRSPSKVKNSATPGAISSWSVQPRLNHRLCLNAYSQASEDIRFLSSPFMETSDR